MNVLVVDDQVNVLKGIESGVHFQELGVDHVFYATDSAQAMDIVRAQTVDIVLSDIEMPGESGLTLVKWVIETYPDTLCILLTSHADFRYAHESIRLGCFDYLLQPAPYEQIEECLRRALQELYERKKKSQIYRFGQMLKTNETELINYAVSNLFSRVEEDKDSSLTMLNAIGYPLSKTTPVQMLIIHAENFSSSESPLYSEKFIHKAILESTKGGGITYPIVALSNITPNKEFCLTLFCTNQEMPEISAEMFRSFYEKLTARMVDEDIMCYVGEIVPLQQVRKEYCRLRETLVEENIGRRPGLYLRSRQNAAASHTVNLSECIIRWKTLLDAGKKWLLENEIEEFIRNTEESSRTKHKALCELHQQLTHIFFSYLYDRKMDMSALFTKEYTYTDYMDSFASVNALRKAVQYMLDSIDKLQERDVPQSDVEKARTYIAENIANPITVMDVAAYVNLSAEYFTKLFKRETGRNIKEYIMQSKIAMAKDLLEHSNMSVSMIALELGYSNFSHFTQVFKKYENITPSEYRSKIQLQRKG